MWYRSGSLLSHYNTAGKQDSSDLLLHIRGWKRLNSAGATVKSSSNWRRSPKSFCQTIVHFWLTELLSWLLASGAVVGIVIVLVFFNGKPIPDWPFGITLGALVSVLATLATVALMVPVDAGISQARWVWFTRERVLKDFELINDASRSPLGALWLLFHWTGGYLAIAGAILTILVVGVNPFVQQVVNHAENEIRNNATAIPVAMRYDSYDQSEVQDVVLSMKAAIQRGILDVDADRPTFYVSVQCPTINCTWQKYSSLSICAECADLSKDLTIKAKDYVSFTVSLPNNITIWETQGDRWPPVMQINSSLSLPSIKFADVYPLLRVFTLVGVPLDAVFPPKIVLPWASECILSFCVRNFTSRSINGTFSETSLGEAVFLDWSSEVLSATTSGGTYSVANASVDAFHHYFAKSFTSDRLSGTEDYTTSWPNDVSQSMFYWMNKSSDHLPTKLFENLAASMELNIRTFSNESRPGVAYSTVSVISVNWYWMILPFAILALVCFHLVEVILVSNAEGLHPWKASSLAPLMHGLVDSESRMLVSHAASLEEMEALAESLLARVTHSTVKDERNGHVGIALRERV